MAKLEELMRSDNIVELLSEDRLEKIGVQIMTGFEIDDESRSEWKQAMKKVLKIAKQVLETKHHPFENASNIKYPLATKAAIDFAARVYPELIKGGRAVKTQVIGEDPTFDKARKAVRVAEHMSYQLLEESEEWEDGTDKLLHLLPIFGTVFKKVFFDPIKGRNVIELVIPDRLVVNQNINSLEEARRITHILEMHPNDIIERQRAGLYADFDISDLMPVPEEDEFMDTDKSAIIHDEDAPMTILECHCFLDLDDDGYQEPYIVTIHKDSGKILRIVSRFDGKPEKRKGKVSRIKAEQFFVDYHFIKSPDGDFYSVGIGRLLLPLNESINTIINQLVDSGTLANLQSGFIGRGLRMRNKSMIVKQGEFQIVDTGTGNDLKNNIVPLPTKEPSQTLFNLLGALIEASKDLSSTTDVLAGKQPAQNVPSTTILTLAEQGLKVFNGIVKRVYRAQKKEFKRIFKLNERFLEDRDYQEALDNPDAFVKSDYDSKSLDVIPVADPASASDAQRLAKARAILELPTVNPILATRNFLEALGLPPAQIEAFAPVPDPNAPPPVDDQKTMAETEKLRAETQEIIASLQIEVQKLSLESTQLQSLVAESNARIQKMAADAENNQNKSGIVGTKSAVETEIKARDQLRKETETSLDAQLEAAKLAIEAEKVRKDEQNRSE